MNGRRARSMAIPGLIVVLTLVCAPLWAQTTDRSGIEGKITDQSGAFVPGVTVTISSPALQRPTMTAVSDANGYYRFTALPKGVYTVTFELSGFQTVKRTDVRLDVGFVATLDIKMAVGGVTETVTVSGESPVVDVRTTTVATNFAKEALETVPTTRSVWQIIDMAPGMRNTTVNPDVGGSLVGTQEYYSNYGSARGGNRPTVEGVDVHDASTDASLYYDFGAFEEVQVKAMGADAEMPYSGTQLLTVIKSGGNTFHGKGLFQYETPKLQSSNVDAALKAKGVSTGNPLVKYFDFSADTGGRIIRDRLWFYGAIRKQGVRSTIIGYPEDSITNLDNYTSKFTGQLTSKHKLVGFAQYTKKDYPNRYATAFVPPETTIHQTLTPLVTKAEWTWTPTSRALVDFLFGRMKWDSIYPPSHPGSGPYTYDNVTLYYSGTGFQNNNSFSARENRQWTGTFTYYKPGFLGGSHDLKAGFEGVQIIYSRSVADRGADGNYRLNFQNGVPYQVVTYNNPFKATVRLGSQSGFVKDTWALGDRLTLNLGVRFERYHPYVPAQDHQAGDFSAAASYPYKEIFVWSGVQPRLAFSYAVTRDKRTVVKGTFGRFGQLINADYALTYNQNNLTTTTYRWNDLNGDKKFTKDEIGTFVSQTGGSSAVLNPDLKQPRSIEATASVERELVRNVSARVSYVYKKEYNLYQNINAARPYSVYTIPITATDPGPDGTVGTADDGQPVTYYDYNAAYAGATFEQNTDQNVPGYADHWNNVEFVVNKRLAQRWQLLSSFLMTKRNMWQWVDYGSTSSTYSGVPVTPNMTFFPKDQTWEWAFKISGSYQLPYDIVAAAFFSSNSGTAYARSARFTTGLKQLASVVLLMQPTGSQRLPSINLMSARAEKRVKMGRTTAAFQFDLFNVLNSNVPTQIVARSGSTYGNPLSILSPRIARLGVTFTY